MFRSACTLLVVAGFATFVHADGVRLRYAGNLVQQPRNGDEVSVKRFGVDALLLPTEGGRTLFFLVEEQGGGGWPWPERFGSVVLDESGGTNDRTRPRLLHTFNDTKYPVSLPLALFGKRDELTAGNRWVVGKNAYDVSGPVKVGDDDAMRVDVSTNFGRTQSLWVEPESGHVLRNVRKVFLGRGDRFELRMELKSADDVTDAEAKRLVTVLDTLTGIQSTLGREDGETDPVIGLRSLDKIAAAVSRLSAESEDTVLARFAKTVVVDVDAQRKRAGDVGALAKKFVGTAIPGLKLADVNGKPIAEDAWRDRLLLLHFWDYRGEPLEEPYGQVGYVSFMQRKRQKLGLSIMGVAVNKGLSDPKSASAVKRGIRKLRDFMNLDYPIGLDDGTLLRKFGDPRRLGAQLPLWVLVAPDGKIVHYHAGFYEINPDKGLEELDNLVVEQIRQLRGRSGE